MARTVVIGGGAAGIAAARTLHDAGAEVLLVEAKDRLGGRAHTVHVDGMALDLGCSWLHSARRNPWTAIAQTQGFDIRTDAAHWGEQWRDLGFPDADRQRFNAARQRLMARARAALDGPDRALADFVSPDDDWFPLLDAISGYANGAPLAGVSLHDWAAYEDAATDDNWAIVQGYGTLIVHHAAGMPVRLATAVTRIDHRGRSIRLDTTGGTIEADRVIVAVPTTALTTDSIVFDPPLPEKQDAAAALPLGLADKVFLCVSGGHEWPDNAHLIGNPSTDCTASYRLAPLGQPTIEAFFGGTCAEMLEDGDAVAFAIDELVALLGSGWRARLVPLARTRWRHEPFIHGSYSHAHIGHAAARDVLAATVDDRLFFAGEACSARDFSTAHGAYETGMAAARAIMQNTLPSR